ncbi:hypothetical protein Scep_026035 [Stephania cephalantha]|uniref:Uncharacterized protein n=1 Tax=Stephania cephalantha TaxID=152367 RepID=A0AAP0EJC8_9MAGN
MTASLPITTSVLCEAISTRAPTFCPTHFAPLVSRRPPFTNSAFSSLSNPSFPSAKRYQPLCRSSSNEEGFVADEEEEEDGFESEEESDGGDIVSFDLRALDKEAKDAVREHSLSVSRELILESGVSFNNDVKKTTNVLRNFTGVESEEEEIENCTIILHCDGKIDSIFFKEEQVNFDEAPKSENDDKEFIKDKVFFRDEDLVVKVIPQSTNPLVLVTMASAGGAFVDNFNLMEVVNIVSQKRVHSSGGCVCHDCGRERVDLFLDLIVESCKSREKTKT